jgi:hypothetical protein
VTLAVASQRVLQGRPATISTTWLDQDGDAGSAVDPVTVTVTDHVGTVVASALSTTWTGGTYDAHLPATATASLDILTAIWTDAAGAKATTSIEVVGGFYFGVTDAMVADRAISAYDTPTIVNARRFVEEECERITGHSFVPRFRQVTLWGTGTNRLRLGVRDVRALRSVALDGTPIGTDALAHMAVTASGEITRAAFPFWMTPDLDYPAEVSYLQRFPLTSRVAIGVEYGLDRPPAEVRFAAIKRLRSVLAEVESPIPDRAERYSAAEGGTYVLSMPSATSTGIPSVDAVYARWTAKGERSTSVPIG